MAKYEGAEHHRQAAEHHEHAARHHREAAKHHEAGAHEAAGDLDITDRGHLVTIQGSRSGSSHILTSGSRAARRRSHLVW